MVLRKVSGAVKDCEIGDIRKAGLLSEDAAGLEIAHNHVRDCGDNGILVWRSVAGEDASIVASNRVERIAAKSGGGGQNGNAILIYPRRLGPGERQPHRRLRLIRPSATIRARTAR